nr:PREDICTED: uncharacterized protein LOC100879228 [Megachile rotundata]
MGNYMNKFFSHNNDIEKEEIRNAHSEMIDNTTIEKDLIFTPPLIQKTLPIDPRSVTTGIERTPIEVNYTSLGLNKRIISAIPKHLQSKQYLETNLDQIMTCLTPKKHFPSRVVESTKLQFSDMPNRNAETFLTPEVNNVNNKKKLSPIEKERYEVLGIDPRSPAANFDRTPILMPKSLELLKARSREDLHKQGSYETDIFYPKFAYCEMSSEFSIPEIQALPDLATCTTKCLDLNDTDDGARSNESETSHSSCSPEIEKVSEDGEKLLESQNETQTTLREDNCNDVYIKKDIEELNVCNNENDNDTIKIWRDTMVLDKVLEFESTELHDMQLVKKKTSQTPKENVIITFDDSSSTKDVLSLKISKTGNDIARVDTTIKKRYLKLDIKTEEKKVFNSNDKNDTESIKARTPLGNRSNNEQRQTLSTKSPQQIFRNKGIASKMLQENTPPHKKHVTKTKLNGVQWDPDSTVII